MINKRQSQSNEIYKKCRHGNSLSVLTQKFIKLIQTSPRQTLDLNQVVEILKVQKRRIYDITNVLEGIGYVQKLSKNKIQWVGSTTDKSLFSQIASLQKQQMLVDQQTKRIQHIILKIQQVVDKRLSQSGPLNFPVEMINSLSKQMTAMQDQKLVIIGSAQQFGQETRSNQIYPYVVQVRGSNLQVLLNQVENMIQVK